MSDGSSGGTDPGLALTALGFGAEDAPHQKTGCLELSVDLRQAPHGTQNLRKRVEAAVREG